MRAKKGPFIKEVLYRLILVVIMAGVLSFSVFAWFVLANRSRSHDLELEMPPIIYIKDDKLQNMVSFDLDGLQINKTYNALFCVAPAYEGAVEDYKLGVIYTENIGMIIDLYPVSGITDRPTGSEYEMRTLEGSDCYFNYTTQDGSWKADVTYSKDRIADETYQQTHLNRGVYKIYDDAFSEYTKTGTDIYTKLNNTEAYRFYVLQVTWKENISEAELEKETDVVYIITEGGTGKGDQGT